MAVMRTSERVHSYHVFVDHVVLTVDHKITVFWFYGMNAIEVDNQVKLKDFV